MRFGLAACAIFSVSVTGCSSANESASDGETAGSGGGGAGTGPASSSSSETTGAGGDAGIGSPCTLKEDCASLGRGADCIGEEYGWPDGYCTIVGCEAGECPDGSECFPTTSGDNFCFETCAAKDECGAGYICLFEACFPGCESKPCGEGQVCDAASDKCVADVDSGPGPGPGPDCDAAMPPRDCAGTPEFCGELVTFDPPQGYGYEDYPINGETLTNQYRSYARRDVVMLVRYAAAYAACKSQAWPFGLTKRIGLGDMSEADGATPGTSVGNPGHPAGTHVDGLDIDVAYFQFSTPDNQLRPVCDHTVDGVDQERCTDVPHLLDAWRTALFMGALFTSDRVRVIGVDGQVGPFIEAVMPKLCGSGWLPPEACAGMAAKLAYEQADDGLGWFYFHHHHMHMSFNSTTGG